MVGSGRLSAVRDRFSVRLFLSYALDWFLLVACGFIALGLGYVEPNKRPFSLTDPNISFPFTESEACPSWLLVVLNAGVPVIGIFVVSLIFVPGATVPRDTPKSLVWKRKLWELHTGLLGLALSLVVAWFFTQGTKNWFGKPRPDLLARCEPDIENAARYAIGGFVGEAATGRLYSANICQQTDKHKLDDGFRSYPSGHSSSAAAGLVYLSLFLASKFAVNIPFVPSGDSVTNSLTRAAFPSRMQRTDDSFNTSGDREAQWNDRSPTPSPTTGKTAYNQGKQNSHIQAIRRQAAAPPVYLLCITFAPFCASIWIAASRWYDFRHHGFDILFGYLMGVATAYFAFRLYHMPMRDGAGWAWGPRSEARAFWAGVGRLGYAGERRNIGDMATKRDDGVSTAGPAHDYHPSGAGALSHANGSTQQTGIARNDQPHAYSGEEDYGVGVARPYGADEYEDVNMQRRQDSLDSRPREVEMHPMQNRI